MRWQGNSCPPQHRVTSQKALLSRKLFRPCSTVLGWNKPAAESSSGSTVEGEGDPALTAIISAMSPFASQACELSGGRRDMTVFSVECKSKLWQGDGRQEYIQRRGFLILLIIQSQIFLIPGQISIPIPLKASAAFLSLKQLILNKCGRKEYWESLWTENVTSLRGSQENRDGKSVHSDDHSFLILKTCHDTGDSREKRLGPPLQQFEPEDHHKDAYDSVELIDDLLGVFVGLL
ncbi:hypothetical protein EYF80_004115 [Liparis tanakae]|uniref:Uncharacterized protein n=1 Tax=Liparis tanakae TaxID=230148 RepID=A0A4Z2J7R4_9TELE|nr:hypothetical protein EYF80_004115 [Liparis tanakae]